MALSFEQGDQERPRGHAIVYYRSGGAIVATYVVVLPLTVDFSKYVPPVLAAQVKMTNLDELAAFAMPPMPENVESLQFLEELARLRGDDLVFGGEVPDNDYLESAQRVNDDVQAYTGLYQRLAGTTAGPQALDSADSELNVDDVMFSLLSEREKLLELSKLVGKLRFAVEGADEALIKEAEEEINTMARHFPENYDIPRLMESSKRKASQLAQLYLERCYKLADQDYLGLQTVESAIQEYQDTAG